jgi:hypothetical protein
VAKQPEPVAKSNYFENADWGLQLPFYQNEGMLHLAAATSLAWCGEEHLTKMAAHLPGNGFKRSSCTNGPVAWLPRTPHHILTRKRFWKCASVDVWHKRSNPLILSSSISSLNSGHILVTVDFRTCVYFRLKLSQKKVLEYGNPIVGHSVFINIATKPVIGEWTNLT